MVRTGLNPPRAGGTSAKRGSLAKQRRCARFRSANYAVSDGWVAAVRYLPPSRMRTSIATNCVDRSLRNACARVVDVRGQNYAVVEGDHASFTVLKVASIFLDSTETRPSRSVHGLCAAALPSWLRSSFFGALTIGQASRRTNPVRLRYVPSRSDSGASRLQIRPKQPVLSTPCVLPTAPIGAVVITAARRVSR